MTRIQILNSASQLDTIRGLWDRLAARPGATLFQQFRWNRLAAEMFAEREHPHVFVATSGDQAAILPLVIRQDGTAALLGETLFDYRDMLSSGDPELELAVLTEAARLGLALEITALTPEIAARWNMFTPHKFCKAPRIVRADCSADRLIDSHRRLGRHSRRIAARGVQLLRRHGSDAAFIRDLYVKKAAQQGSLFTDPLRREFMERICREEGDRCQVFTYETSNDLVAAILTLQHGHARHFYTVYYDIEWSAYSPGQVLLFESSVQTLAEDLDCDFLTGEYPYKMRLATEAVPLIRIQATAEEWQSAIERHGAHIAA